MIKNTLFNIEKIKDNLKLIDELTLAKLIYSIAIKLDIPIVFFRDSNNNILFITDFSNDYILKDLKDNTKSGFIFSPFLLDETNCSESKIKPILIKDSLVINITSKTIDIKNVISSLIYENFLSELQALIENKKVNIEIKEFIRIRNKDYVSYTKSEFCNLVSKAIKKIETSSILKIVTSRTLKKEIPNNFSIINTFHKMSKKYTDAFVYLISTKESGTWMGASPEILLKEEDNSYYTMSLAGTQKYYSEIHIDHYKWTNKEIQEQKIVTEYIDNILIDNNLDYEETQPFNVKAGNVIHLRSDFKIKSINNHSKFNKLLKELHPTPAVCGLPKIEALSFIIENELHDRDFYTGFLGTINIDKKSHLRVNLRCMEFSKDSIILYLGCGINKDSNPEKEWFETEIKAETLLSII
jgi:isochorismate synthase